MIRRSEYGPRCPHCTQVNPAGVLEQVGGGSVDCLHCRKPFSYWIERLPFYCTDDGQRPHCECAVCSGKPAEPAA
jgi:hypothetical protein